jgi:two-component system, OmpR family, phosphate regulon response regulator PhoB
MHESPSTEVSTSEAGPSQTPVRILVVDERVLADLTAMVLDRAGFLAIPADTEEDAISAAEQAAPDIVIIEWLMAPKIKDSTELAERIRRIVPQCRMVFCTGRGTEDIGHLQTIARRTLGHFQIFQKPIYPEDLIRFLRRLRLHDIPVVWFARK